MGTKYLNQMIELNGKAFIIDHVKDFLETLESNDFECHNGEMLIDLLRSHNEITDEVFAEIAGTPEGAK